MSAVRPDSEGHTGHERRDMPVRAMAWIMLAFIVAGGIINVCVVWLTGRLEFRRIDSFPPASPVADVRPLPPPPRLQVSPADDLRAMRQREAEVLESYGWVDRGKGVVRIPIERAMKLIAERGLPASQPETKP